MNLTNARVLVTGGTGFLGQHVGTALREDGAEAVLVGRGDGDLCDAVAVASLLRRTAPTAVVHLAAVVGGIGANRREPGRFFYENMLMGLNVIEACRQMSIEKLLVVGTACSYPGDAPIPTSEDHLWDGFPEKTNAPYGIAKRALVTQAQAYRAQYHSNIVVAIPTNLYGPGDNFDLDSGHVIPNLIRRFSEAVAQKSDCVTLWGDGSPTRDFLYVTDAARGCARALATCDDGDPLNLSSGVELSIASLASTIANLTGYEGSIAWDTAMPNGQQRRQLDATRTTARIGWRPQVSLEEGLANTVDWYRQRFVTR
jgi:GDP-L-fucose synthase